MAFEFKVGITRSLKWLNYGLTILLLTTALGFRCRGVTLNVINGMSFSGLSTRPSDCFGSGHRDCSSEEIESLTFAQIDTQISVFPEGGGECLEATVDFGDGTPPKRLFFFDINHSIHATHTYTGWPGTKLVRVKGVDGCLGDVTKVITVGIGPDGRNLSLGFCVGGPQCTGHLTSVCTVVNVVTPTSTHSMPPIREGSVVRIETNGLTIDYGSGHIFDASGDPSAPIPPNYLFHNRKKFSLVYRIGSTDFQGEAGRVFLRADQTAPLEVCTNDNPSFLADNTGGMMLTFSVNEVSATVP